MDGGKTVKYVDCLTGGVTTPAIKKVLEAALRYAPQPNWHLRSFDLAPTPGGDYCVNFMLASTTDPEEEEIFIETDGLSWGYGGEGPHGLAVVLADLLIYYKQSGLPTNDLRAKAFQWVARQPQNKPQTLSPLDLLNRLA